jgi:hypothetical protein
MNYQVKRGTWDTYIVPIDLPSDTSDINPIFPTWKQAQEYALQHLDNVLVEVGQFPFEEDPPAAANAAAE